MFDRAHERGLGTAGARKERDRIPWLGDLGITVDHADKRPGSTERAWYPLDCDRHSVVVGRAPGRLRGTRLGHCAVFRRKLRRKAGFSNLRETSLSFRTVKRIRIFIIVGVSDGHVRVRRLHHQHFSLSKKSADEPVCLHAIGPDPCFGIYFLTFGMTVVGSVERYDLERHGNLRLGVAVTRLLSREIRSSGSVRRTLTMGP